VADVLVVDDDDAIRSLVCDVLEMEGHRPVAMPDGPSALAYLRTSRPDCVVLDVMMPGQDGFEVLSQIREQPHLADLPVALLTAAADDASVWRGWQSGASWFFTKPVDFEALLGFVSALQPGRRRKAAPTSSPYALIADRVALGEAAESTLLQIIRALESQAQLFGTPMLVLTSVPGPDVLRGSRMSRLEALAERGADVVVLGRRIPRRVTRGGAPHLVPLRQDDCLQQEWVHIVASPRVTSAVVCRTTPSGNGRWSFGLTHDPELVEAAATTVLDRVPHLQLTMPPLSRSTAPVAENPADENPADDDVAVEHVAG
jgi:DNA-binding response OmpR family regulator